MCGILGVAGGRLAPGALLAPLESLRHRGPDSEGRFDAPGVALAIRRLAIIDPDGGDQPLRNEDGTVVAICNGELYNYVELRAELRGRGHRFTTGSDVEVLVHLYEDEGVACFDRVRGMFAAALWDTRRGRLVLARDRLGIKPLYIADVAGGLGFASEVAPLLALGASAEPDVQAIADYLSLGYVPGAGCGLDGVRSLAAGHVLVWEGGRVEERAIAAAGRAASTLEETLEEAVRIHLRSDVPLAVLLSGGLDSSLIAALVASELERPVKTFTVGFGEAAYDELEHARTVAGAIGAEHHEVAVRPDVADDLPEIVRRLDEPNGDVSAVPLYYVCQAVSGQVKVALAGEGGDEVFGGYSRYAWDGRAGRLGRVIPAASLARLLDRIPAVARATSRRDRKSIVRRAQKLLQYAQLPAPERYFSWFALMTDDAKAEILQADAEPAARIYTDLFAAAPAGLSPLARLQYVDLRTMLAKDLLVKADRMSMAHSLELRVPLLDPAVVAAGLGLPDRDKVRGVQTKVAIRALVERRLPRSIARRPKQGFEVPIDRWLREGLAPLAKELLSRDRVGRRGLLRPEVVERRLEEHLSGRADHGLSLYGLMTLELWLEGVVDRRGSPDPVGFR